LYQPMEQPRLNPVIVRVSENGYFYRKEVFLLQKPPKTTVTNK